MKPGDLVRWVGFSKIKRQTNPSIGIVIKTWTSPFNSLDMRVDIIWGGSCSIRKGIYAYTIEVVE